METGSGVKRNSRHERSSSIARVRRAVIGLSLLAVCGILLVGAGRMLGVAPSLQLFPDSSGYLGTLSTTGSIDTTNPFFQSLGTNGRACVTCHMPGDAWSVTPTHIQQRFTASNGSDPIFRPVDGSVCTDAAGVNSVPPATSAYSLLLKKGLFRISLPLPSNAQFTVKVVSDPYGCAMTTDSTGKVSLSMYRRPLPATNLGFLSTVMFDGRETLKPLNDPSTFRSNLIFDLSHQALDATLGHAQAAKAPTASQLQEIVDFELTTFTAQQVDSAAGNLTSQNSRGGPLYLSTLPYYPGINDPLGGNPTGAAFNPDAFTLFSAWQSLQSSNPYTAARESVARGEAIFDSAPLTIQDVKGLNDALGVATITGTCSTCHDTPGVGDHSLPLPLDIGISGVPRSKRDPLLDALAELNRPSLPVYAVTCSTKLGGPSNFTVQTTDPGRAMISGLCADIGKVKGPILRGLAARAPYFHDGAADSLNQVVSFYNERFQMGLTANEMADLVAFLRSL